MMAVENHTLVVPHAETTAKLIAVATYPLLDTPVVDLVYQVAPGHFRLHQGVCSEQPADEGEEIDDLELIEWAAIAGENVIMVGPRAGA